VKKTNITHSHIQNLDKKIKEKEWHEYKVGLFESVNQGRGEAKGEEHGV
jgi:hypothetical protein